MPGADLAALRRDALDAFGTRFAIANVLHGAVALYDADKLNTEIDAGLADPKILARLADFGATAFVASPADLDKLVVEQTEKWGSVIRAANIKVD